MPTDVEIAANWLADQPAGNPRIIGELKQRFELSAKQACEAIARANLIRTGRPA